MDLDSPARGRGVMLLVVLGVIAFVVACYLLITEVLLGGDDPDEVNPQNGDAAPALVR